MAEGSNRTAARDDARASSGSGVIGAIFRNLVTLFFIGVSVMCVYNVFGVGTEVEKLATELVCQGRPLPCNAGYSKAGRTPFAHTFRMVVTSTEGSKVRNLVEKDVVCRRQYIFLGDYACKYEDEAGAAAMGPDAAVTAGSYLDPASTSAAPMRFPPKTKGPATPKAPAPAGSLGQK